MDNKEEFDHSFKQIFSQELKMKNENVNNYVTTLLDLNITVKEEQILTKNCTIKAMDFLFSWWNYHTNIATFLLKWFTKPLM